MIFTKKNKKSICFIMLFLCFQFITIAQEDCANGIDDDGDGLIDLQDEVDCVCLEEVWSIIEGDFEYNVCCPTTMTVSSDQNNGIYCLDDGWVPANGTPDYFHMCGYLGVYGETPVIPLPIPDGLGAMGLITNYENNFFEVIGLCLDGALIAGETYTFSFYIGFNSSFSFSSDLEVDVELFGSTTCEDLEEFNFNYGCLSENAEWESMHIEPVVGLMDSSWLFVQTSFVAGISAEAIAIGLDCDGEDPQYHFFDDFLIVGNMMQDKIGDEIIMSGDCVSGITLEVPSIFNATYQWYLDGVAIVGATANPYVITDAADGNYTVVVTTNLGCAISPEIAVLVDLNVLEVTGDVTDLSCADVESGEIDVSTNSMNDPLMYIWSNASTDEDLYDLGPGSYTVTVTDDYGCIGTSEFIVDVPDPVDIQFSGDCNHGFFLTVIDPLPDANYEWYFDGNLIAEGAVNPYYIENIGGNGYYYVFLEDGESCLQSIPIIVYMDPEGLQLSGEVVHIDCYGTETGSIDLNVENSSFDYSIEWNSGQTDEDLENLAAGQYEVTVTNEYGCFGVMVFDINQVDSLSNELIVTQPNGGTLGAASVNTSGGTMPYEYLWNTGNTNSFDNELLPGTYTITITDVNGCEEVLEFVIESNFEVDFMVFSGTCPGMCEDSIALTVIGPDVDYFIEWDDESLIGFNPNNLCSGVYNFTVSNDNGAQITGSVIIDEGDGVSVSGTFDSLLCFGMETTDIILSVTNGVEPYVIEWNTSSDNDTLFQVSSGVYDVTVTDNLGCSAMERFIISEFPEIEVESTVQLAGCIGESNGGIDLTISGGTSPFDILWHNGATTEEINNLSPGEYIYIITDNNGCEKSDSIVVDTYEESSFSILEIICDEDNATYTVSYTVEGNAYPYNINDQIINEGGYLNLNANSGDSLAILVIDANLCEIYNETVFFVCDCNSDLGIMDGNLIESCFDESITVLPSTGGIVSDSDSLIYVLHSSSGSSINNILEVSVDGEFNFNPLLMSYNTIYYVSSVVYAGGVFDLSTLNEICTESSIGTPVLWLPENRVVLPGNLAFCEDDEIEISIMYSGAVPITLRLTDGNTYTTEVTITEEGESTFIIDVTESVNLNIDWYFGSDCLLDVIGQLEIELKDLPLVEFASDITTCNTSISGSTISLDDLIISSNSSGGWIDHQGDPVSGTIDFDGFSAGLYSYQYITAGNQPCEETTYTIPILVEECDCPMNIFLPFEGLCQGAYVINLNDYLNPIFLDAGFWSISTISGTGDLVLIESDLTIENTNVGRYQATYTFYEVPVGCEEDFSFEIEIGQMLSAGTVSLSPVEICLGDLFEIGLFEYVEDYDAGGEWSSQDGIPIDILTGTVDLFSAVGGLYTFAYEIPEDEFCPASMTEISILIHDPIELFLSILDPLCFGLNDGSVSVEDINGAHVDFNLYDSDQVVISNPDSLFAGEYELSIVDENGCVIVENFTLIDPLELFLDLGEDRVVEEGEVTTISPVINFEGDDISLFQWFVNQASLNIPTFDTLLISPDSETTVQLIITDDDGCIVVDDVLLTLLGSEVPVVMANVFNPLNNSFGIEAFEEIELVNSFSIFDRWGSLIFKQNEFLPSDQSKRWDGSYNGSAVVNGVYVFSIEYTNSKGARVTIFGDVTVVRM